MEAYKKITNIISSNDYTNNRNNILIYIDNKLFTIFYTKSVHSFSIN